MLVTDRQTNQQMLVKHNLFGVDYYFETLRLR